MLDAIRRRAGKVIDKVKLRHFGLAMTTAALALAGPLGAQGPRDAGTGPDAAACTPGSRASALLVRVHGFKRREGLLRVSTYVANEAEWLVKGRYVRRIDVAVPVQGSAAVCVALPVAGSYAVAVLHDRNSNHRANIFSDGGGFSNNPRLGLSKPGVEKVAFAAGAGVTVLDIDLRYL